MKIILATFLLLSFKYSHAQIYTISPAQVENYIGKEVFLRGKVVNFNNHISKYGEELLFLDLDKPYLNNTIAITIFSNVFSKIKIPQNQLYNKSFLIKGKIDLYRNKPNLVVKKVDNFQLKIIDN